MGKGAFGLKEEAALARTVIKKRLAGQPAPDIWFLIILMLLVCYGLVMLFSAGYAVALYRRGDAYTYIRPQLLFAAFGAAAMYAASLVDYHIWHKLAWPIMGVSLALLAIVLFMPEYNGCKRWIVLPGLGTLQPSEIAKFAVVLVFAHIISLNHDRMQTFATGVLPFMVILGEVTVLMLLEPHLSGTLLILGIGAVLMFVGGTGLKWFALAGIAGAGAIAAAVVLLPELEPYGAAVLLAGPLCRSAGRRPPDHPKPVRHCIWRRGRAGAGQQPPEIPLCAGTAERLYLFDSV